MTTDFQIQPLTSDLVSQAAPLFAQYPYKQTQRIRQQLDAERMNAFYLRGLEAQIARGEKVWLATGDGEPTAMGGLAPDAWHSEIYGMKMGKIQPWLNTRGARGEATAGGEILKCLLDEAARENYEHLSVRIDGEDFPNLHLFESNGFHLIDVSMKFSRPMPFAPEVQQAERTGWGVRLAEAGDEAWMRALGSRAHANTHFLNDPTLSESATQRLFDEWVKKCIDKLAFRIYVLERREENGASTPCGFVIYLRNNALRQATERYPIILDYVILDPSVRGGGVGSWFVQESLKREEGEGFDFCELRTSHHNLAAVGTYAKLGFSLVATDLVLHRKL